MTNNKITNTVASFNRILIHRGNTYIQYAIAGGGACCDSALGPQHCHTKRLFISKEANKICWSGEVLGIDSMEPDHIMLMFLKT